MTQALDESGWPDEGEDQALPPGPPDMTLRDDDGPAALPPAVDPRGDLLESDPVPPAPPDKTLRDDAAPLDLLVSEPLDVSDDDVADDVLASGAQLGPPPDLADDDLLLESEIELSEPSAPADDEPSTIADAPRLVDVIRGGPTEAYRAAGSVLGPYLVEAEVARGGMGAVYRAHHEQLTDRKVALKVLLAGAGATPRQRQRFLREATVGAKLLHPGIVRVHDYGEESAVPWLALEFVEGPTLRDRIGELTVNALVELLARACRALEAAHDAGVVHRDLKPANIMIRPGGEPALTDFGLARDLSAHSSITKDGTALGTPFYMAPEQTRGKTPAPATDVFAMGVLLYQGLTGELPFTGDTIAALYDQINNVEPPPPSQVAPERAPPLLDHVVARALQKEPGRRYRHAGKLARDLERFLDGTLTPPPPDVRAPVLLVLGALAVVAVGSLIGLWLRGGEPPTDPGGVAAVDSRRVAGPRPLPFEPPRLPRPQDPLPTGLASEAPELIERPDWAVAHGLSLTEARERVADLARRRLAPVAIHVNHASARPRFALVWRRLAEGEAAHTELSLDVAGLGREHGARPKARLAALAVHGVYPRERYAATWVTGGPPRPAQIRFHIDPGAWAEVAGRQTGRVTQLCATGGRHARLAAAWVADGRKGAAVVDAKPGRWRPEVVQRSARGQRLIGSARIRQHERVVRAGVWVEDGRGALTFAGRTPEEHALIARVAGAYGYRPVWLAERGRARRRRLLSSWVRAPARTWRGAGPAVGAALAPLETEVRAFMERHDVGAAALAITRAGRLVLARGYAFGPEGTTAVGPRSRFRIGQASQPLVSVAALRLIGEGRLRLDQTLGQLFPELRRPGPQQASDPRLAGVSVRRLLTHRAGWERYRVPNRFHPSLGYPLTDPTFGFDREVLATLSARGPLTPEHVFRYATKQPLEHAPGAAHHESPLGYVILGRVLERVTGRDLRAVLAKEVLGPLSASDFAPAGAQLTERVAGEVLYQGSRVVVPMRGAPWRLGPQQYGGFTPAASYGWVTSVVDLARFVSSFSGRSLLTAQAVREAWRAQPDSTFGMGWHVEDGAVWQTGRLPGSFAHLRRLRDGTGLVLLLNADAPGEELVERLAIHLTQLPDRDWPSEDLFR